MCFMLNSQKIISYALDKIDIKAVNKLKSSNKILRTWYDGKINYLVKT